MTGLELARRAGPARDAAVERLEEASRPLALAPSPFPWPRHCSKGTQGEGKSLGPSSPHSAATFPQPSHALWELGSEGAGRYPDQRLCWERGTGPRPATGADSVRFGMKAERAAALREQVRGGPGRGRAPAAREKPSPRTQAPPGGPRGGVAVAAGRGRARGISAEARGPGVLAGAATRLPAGRGPRPRGAARPRAGRRRAPMTPPARAPTSAAGGPGSSLGAQFPSPRPGRPLRPQDPSPDLQGRVQRGP